MASTDTATSEKTNLKSLDREELGDFCEDLGLRSFRTDQIFQWLYQKRATSFEEMTNLSKDLRSQLSDMATIHGLEPVERQQSADGTIKFLFKMHNGDKVESVLIPDFYPDGAPNRLTVCVSSQVGCVFGCSFCATGKMGFFRNLTHGEIVDQVQYINEISEEVYDKEITNIVYMGMGEPLHNYEAVVESANIITNELSLDLSPRRVTISTVGLTKQIKKMADTRQPFNLAISLHAASDEKRDEIMPINESMDLNALEEAVTYYYDKTHQPITYEYLLFNGFNDTKDDADQLATIAQWVPSKVNIIMYNNVSGVELQRAREDRLDCFIKRLTEQGVTATVRRSRGDDIDAGCGQLAIKNGQTKGKTIAKD